MFTAYKASDYLTNLINHGTIRPEPNALLDKLYSEYQPKALPPPTPDSTATPNPPQTDVPRVLLTREAIPFIKSTFELGSQEEADMYRAFEQAGKRMEVLQKPDGAR
jgi:hypothetical protein